MRFYFRACLMGLMLFSAPARAEVVCSDTFDRENSPLELGTTEEGYVWRRRDTSEGAAFFAPGIRDKALIFDKGGDVGADMIYLSEAAVKVRDFEMTFDLKMADSVGPQAFTVNFRMPRAGGAVSDGGKAGGYALQLSRKGTGSIAAKLVSDYDPFGLSTSVVHRLDDSAFSVKVISQGKNHKVWLAGELAIDYTDTTDNPSASNKGFFSLQSTAWRSFQLDNLIIKRGLND